MTDKKLNPESWLTEYGDILYRYAFYRVDSEAAAEDLVQETLLAGWQNKASFNHQSSVSSWLVGILKNKISDYYRKSQRETPLSEIELGNDLLAYQFDEEGHWQVDLIDWKSPEAAFDNHAFWQVFQQCQSRLPETMRQLFMMRIDGMSTEECCQILGFNANQLWVTLSRTRMKLRQCLETLWFDKGEQ